MPETHDLTCDYVLYRFPRCLCSSGWVGGHSFPSSRVLLATASGTERSLNPKGGDRNGCETEFDATLGDAFLEQLTKRVRDRNVRSLPLSLKACSLF